MTDRMIRVNSLVKEEIGRILQHDMKNTDLGFITVLRAEISKDLKYGKIFVSIFGEPQDKQRILETLNHATAHIQKLLNTRIRLRYTPKLTFISDEGIDHSIHIQEVLNEIHARKQQELRDHPPEETEGDA